MMRSTLAWVGVLGGLAGGAACGGPPRPVTALNHSAAASATVRPAATTRELVSAETSDCDAIAVFEAGAQIGKVCRADAAARGLTILDLSDDWTPAVLTRAMSGATPEYRAHYIAIANEELGDDAEPQDKLAELYGVSPALSVVRKRLGETKRHACWAEVDPAPITALGRIYSQSDKARVAVGQNRRRALARKLEPARLKAGLPDIAALAAQPGVSKAVAKQVAAYVALDAQHAGLVAMQAKLDCEGDYIAEERAGDFTWRTGQGVELFQRRNFLMPNGKLDAETRDAMALDSRELDFRLALRILRERVADAGAIIEDGSAGDGPRPVLGRQLDPPDMRAARGHAPMSNAAPDLLHPSTEAAARALGWTDPAAVAAFLEAHHGGYEVAVVLPPRPAYYATHMALSAEIDRGDVWYDEVPRHRRVKHRPTLVLYVDDGGVKRPLIRWPTTIGGWADEAVGSAGYVVRKWKESDVGKRVWKDLYGGPTWTPPPTTPDRDLVRNLYNGRYRLKHEIFGPGAHSAYGLVILVHHREVVKDGVIARYDDNGIRTHGSSTVTSIVNGTSHGCHRLYNQLAVRLTGFLLRHRDHLVRGEQVINYKRRVRHKGDFQAHVDTKGFLYELTPPVPIEVTKGRILSTRKRPPKNTAPAKP
jgi:hypothetical protein